jgi:ketosteroid isomerase-like protein
MTKPRRRASLFVLGAVLAVLSGSACAHAQRTSPSAPSPSAPPDDVVALLKRQTQELMDAVAPGKAEVWQRYLLDDVVYVDENGVVYAKATLLEELKPLPAGLVGRIEVDRFQARVHGDTAVTAAEIQEYLDYYGQELRTRFRFVDTWVRTPEGWRLAARHTAAVLKDPPAISLSQEELCAYAGEYRLTPEITTKVSCTKGALIAERTGRPPAAYVPEVRDVFFVAGEPRSRRIFTRDAAGAIVGFIDRREGDDVRWQKTR